MFVERTDELRLKAVSGNSRSFSAKRRESSLSKPSSSLPRFRAERWGYTIVQKYFEKLLSKASHIRLPYRDERFRKLETGKSRGFAPVSGSQPVHVVLRDIASIIRGGDVDRSKESITRTRRKVQYETDHTESQLEERRIRETARLTLVRRTAPGTLFDQESSTYRLPPFSIQVSDAHGNATKSGPVEKIEG